MFRIKRNSRFLHSFGIVKVFRAVRQQKHLLGRHRRPVGDGLGHRRPLRPGDFGTQPPAVGTQREREHPGYADQVFWFEAGQRHAVRLIAVFEARVFRVEVVVAAIAGRPLVFPARPLRTTAGRLRLAGAGRVAVADIQKNRAVAAQHPAHLAEYLDQVRDVERRRRLEPERAAPGAAEAEATFNLAVGLFACRI